MTDIRDLVTRLDDVTRKAVAHIRDAKVNVVAGARY
jgi:hypothetical protein